MRTVFMGTPRFAVPSLLALAGSHDVSLVVTMPDRPFGRGRRTAPSPVKEEALRLGLTVIQPESLSSPAAIDRLRAAAPDAICVVAFGRILPVEVLGMPRFGCVNVHASLLPEYRGAAPIHRAILDGREVTGVSVMKMEEGLDTGPFAKRVEVPVGERYLGELSEELASAGAQALVEVLARMEAGGVEWTPQDDAAASYAPKVTRSDLVLDPREPAATALRKVRAASASVPAQALVAARRVNLVRAELLEGVQLPPGSVRIVKDALELGFAVGSLRATSLVPEGRKEMTGAEFGRGLRCDGDVSWSGP